MAHAGERQCEQPAQALQARDRVRPVRSQPLPHLSLIYRHEKPCDYSRWLCGNDPTGSLFAFEKACEMIHQHLPACLKASELRARIAREVVIDCLLYGEARQFWLARPIAVPRLKKLSVRLACLWSCGSMAPRLPEALHGHR